MPELMLTEDDGIYCGGGLHAALDLSLYLVEKHCGQEVAAECRRAMLLETPRTWQPGFGLVAVQTSHRDRDIGRAEQWLRENFFRTFSIEQLARYVGMSLRNFVRRFKAATGRAPLAYLQARRIAAARRLLENDDRTVQEIAQAVGYEDPVFFREVFRRVAGMTPQAYRMRHGSARGQRLAGSATARERPAGARHPLRGPASGSAARRPARARDRDRRASGRTLH